MLPSNKAPWGFVGWGFTCKMISLVGVYSKGAYLRMDSQVSQFPRRKELSGIEIVKYIVYKFLIIEAEQHFYVSKQNNFFFTDLCFIIWQYFKYQLCSLLTYLHRGL